MHLQGRAALVAVRQSRQGVAGVGRQFYKGGFENKMNKKEASLILSLKYALISVRNSFEEPHLTSATVSERLRRKRSARTIDSLCF